MAGAGALLAIPALAMPLQHRFRRALVANAAAQASAGQPPFHPKPSAQDLLLSRRRCPLTMGDGRKVSKQVMPVEHSVKFQPQ